MSGSLTQTTTLNLTVNPAGSPAVTLSPTSLSMGGIAVGSTTAPKTARLTNTGNAALNFTSVAISGDFALVPGKYTCAGTLSAGQSCFIKVTFTPTQKGLRTGDVTLNSNAPGSPQQLPLSGTGK